MVTKLTGLSSTSPTDLAPYILARYDVNGDGKLSPSEVRVVAAVCVRGGGGVGKACTWQWPGCASMQAPPMQTPQAPPTSAPPRARQVKELREELLALIHKPFFVFLSDRTFQVCCAGRHARQRTCVRCGHCCAPSCRWGTC